MKPYGTRPRPPIQIAFLPDGGIVDERSKVITGEANPVADVRKRAAVFAAVTALGCADAGGTRQPENRSPRLAICLAQATVYDAFVAALPGFPCMRSGPGFAVHLRAEECRTP